MYYDCITLRYIPNQYCFMQLLSFRPWHFTPIHTDLWYQNKRQQKKKPDENQRNIWAKSTLSSSSSRERRLIQMGSQPTKNRKNRTPPIDRLVSAFLWRTSVTRAARAVIVSGSEQLRAILSSSEQFWAVPSSPQKHPLIPPPESHYLATCKCHLEPMMEQLRAAPSGSQTLPIYQRCLDWAQEGEKTHLKAPNVKGERCVWLWYDRVKNLGMWRWKDLIGWPEVWWG